MNNKKIVGNGSKATLPGGKKMEDYKKPPSYNSATKTNALAGSGNNSEQTEEKQKSKGQQNAQATGTEAAKEALKKAAGTIPYTKWIPKGIRDKIIDKFMDSGAGQAAVEKAMKDVKKKLIMILISLAGSVLMALLGLVIIYVIIMYPLGWVRDATNAVKNFGISIYNFAIGKGWCSDSDSCDNRKQKFYYERLNAEAEDYYDYCNVELNQELLTATIFYGRMIRRDDNELIDTNSSDREYVFTQDDVNEIDNLGKVYRNQISATSCPLAKSDDYKDIGKDIADMLNGKYTEGQLDQFLITWRGKLNDLTLENLIQEFGEAVEGNKNFWEDILMKIKADFSCFDYVFDSVKQVINPKSQCSFDENNYKNYLVNYYIPDHYTYLMKAPYNLTKEEIADEIMLLGEVNYSNKDITIVEGTDGMFTMLPSGLNLRVTSNPANCRCHPTRKIYESHKGVDIGGAAYGTSILALEDGIIDKIIIKNVVTCGSSIIRLKHVDTNGDVYYTRYVHLNRASNALLSKFKVGDTVTKGQVIGYVGGTVSEDSCSTGPHLHFEVYNSEGKSINPLVALRNYNNGLPVISNQEIINVCSVNGRSC